MDDIINYVMNTPANTNPNVLKSLLDKMRDSSEEEIQGVAFYDYDGTLVKNVSAEDFANMTAMPENPKHRGLIAQGWNWTLEAAKAYVAKYGALDIGQLYITDDGKTRLYFHVEEDGTQVHVSWPSGTIDWGDGSGETGSAHTYAAGDYVATCLPWQPNVGLLINNTYYSGNAKALKRIEIGNDIVKIRCTGCTNLETISVPVSMTQLTTDIGFSSCISLKSLVIPSGNTSIAGSKFADCLSLKSVCFPPNGITTVGSSAFNNCISLERATIPPSAEQVSGSVFRGCESLKMVVLPDEITNLGSSVFNQCVSLLSIRLPSSLETVPNDVVYGCRSLRSAVLPQSAVSIGQTTFAGVNTLQSLTIPQGVTSIGTLILTDCYSLSSLHMLPETPPTLGGGIFGQGKCADLIIYVPVGCLEAYQTASGWSTYASIMREEGT